MSKKLKLILTISVVLLGAYFINIALKDDAQEIKKVVNSLNQPMTNIAHIEFLDKKKAIAFYEWGHSEQTYFGTAIFNKGLLGWKFLGGSTGQLPNDYKLDWGFSNLEHNFSEYTDLLTGKILDTRIEEVKIVAKSGNEYEANIIKYNSDEKFWFLITNGDDLLGSNVIGLSSEGKVIEQITR